MTAAAIEVALADEAATLALGARLAPHLRAGDVIALRGDLGAGKTTLTRGLVRALIDPETEVPSPTYTLVQTYDTPAGSLWHFDLYRLKYEPDALIELGWDDTPDGIAVLEWPDRAGRYLPANRLEITLNRTQDGRIARLEPMGEDWQDRLHGI